MIEAIIIIAGLEACYYFKAQSRGDRKLLKQLIEQENKQDNETH